MDWDDDGMDMGSEEMTTLVAEAEEELDRAEGVLLQMEAAGGQFGRRDGDQASLDTLFRSMHTLKGNAASVGWVEMTRLAHAAEDLMQGVRDGMVTPSEEIADVLLRAVDVMRELTAALGSGGQPPDVPESLVAEIGRLSASDGEVRCPGDSGSVDILGYAPDPPEMNADSICEVRVRVSEETDIPAVRALQVILACEDYAREMISNPPKEGIDEGALEDGGWVICHLGDPSDVDHLEGILWDIEGVVEVERGRMEESAPGPTAETDDVPAETESATSRSGRSTESRQIRVDVALMDRLMNQVVEMVINRNRLSSLIDTLADHGLSNLSEEMSATVEQMAGITTSLQEDIMQTRLVPLENLFRRFPRMMRNLRKSSGKEFEFEVEGGDTEIDRSLMDAIGDPLIHILRNAVDHGIEDPKTREEAGKSPGGVIRLSAFRQENHIIVEVSDDGGGLDFDAITARARRQGIIDVDGERRMSEEDVLDLLFSPGFSTSEEITEISGRGVGLDVVRRDVEEVNGTVVVDNREGSGSTFRLSLPLTVTTVRSLLVDIGGQVYVIPLGSIRETIRLESVDLHRAGETPMLPFRGDYIPLFRLEDFFSGCEGASSSGREGYIVVLSMDRRDYGLLVDDLLGEEESVIKPLRRPIGNIPGISSATIRPDGRVALILDANGLFKEMRRTARRVINE